MYDNTNKGLIAKNPRKESDKHPDLKGSINVDGRDYWLSGWLKKNSRDGSIFYSLSVQPKEAARGAERHQPKQSQVTQRPTSYDDSYDDEVPF